MLEIGNSLRQAREHRGLSYANVEAATLIPARYLQAIEAEQFDRLPEGLYRRSFLREYAEYLGLDGGIFVAEYELRFAPPEAEPALVRPAPRRSRGNRLAELVPSGWRALVVALIVVVLAGAWWLGGRGTALRGHPAAPAPTPPTTPSLPEPKAPPAPPSAQREAPPVLVLTAARGACWLSVRVGSATGPEIYQQTLPVGGSLRFGLRRPLRIRIGAPWNLTARIGGRSVTTSLPPVTANVIVTRSGVKAAA
jgi:cytoskeleton protein RodZ